MLVIIGIKHRLQFSTVLTVGNAKIRGYSVKIMKKTLVAPNFTFTLPIEFSSRPKMPDLNIGRYSSSAHRPWAQGCMRDVGYGFTAQSPCVWQ